jgi:glyoxylase-like metal-dependent hydrolase (beta-lactamase superfamily II)
MDTVELRPGLLYMFRFSVGQAYLWRDAASLTLIDTGPPGSAPDIAAALTQLGLQAGDLDRILLTHFRPAGSIVSSPKVTCSTWVAGRP